MGDLNKVWEIRALKRKPRHDEAKQMLERIANQVQPIMRKHNWRVKVLSEFCPKRRQLLGLNVGAGVEVKLRLRRPDRELEFYPFDEVLDTMLHELCHNAHGPHNASFYQLWDQLRKECEELMAKGITGSGTGFDLPGKRLGGFSRQPPLSSLRKTALAAAEKRSRLNILLPSGPLRLGGDKKIMSALSPVQAAAMAAERRLQDDIWCASASGGFDVAEEDSNAEEDTNTSCSSAAVSRKRSQESDDCLSTRYHRVHGADLIDLTSDVNPGKRVCGDHPGSAFVGSSTGTSTTAMWNCEACTLMNPPLALVCEACETLKPKDASVKYKFWSCKFCTLENSVSLEKCSACGQWRYSRGAPLSTRPPNLGT